ncbi:capsular polysaccharide export protein, LipB/KpsS family [Aeromonas caviae]
MSNLPGKTFFDTHGSNARSSLYKYNSLFYGDISAYDEWRCEYLKLGSNKQRFRKKSKVQLLISLINRMWSKLCGYISPYEQKTIDSIKNKVFQKRTLNWDFDEISENESYVFFPMQLASDSQLKFNSDIDNIEAIEWICKNGILGNQILVVKPHPAEYDKLMTEKVLALKKKYNFKLTNNSSIDICKGAEKVFTINSTVGLEAMIIGSNVEFLGKSFYSKFTGDDLKNYIINHLVNIDFFTGNTPDMKKAFDGLMSHVFKS